MNLLKVFLQLVFGCINIIVALSIYYNISSIPAGYENIGILPIIFTIVYFVIFRIALKSKYKFTVVGIVIIQWIRFVLMPLVISLSDGNIGMYYFSPERKTLELAMNIMIYELIFTSILLIIIISLMEKYFPVKSVLTQVKLLGNQKIYFLFVLFSIAVFLTVGQNINLINLIFIPVDESSPERVGDATNSLIILAQQIVLIGYFLVFLLLTNYFFRLYRKSNNILYVYMNIIIALFSVSIIIGERRSAQLYIALATIWILINTYPKFKKSITMSVGGVALSIIGLMSIYKFFGAFLTGSYADAMSTANIDMSWLSQTLQIYFFGPENIAVALEFHFNNNVNVYHVILDTIRSTFLVNTIVPDDYLTVSQRFNYDIYHGTQISGHLISAAAYGYMMVGLIGVPIFAVLNIIMSVIIENRMYAVKSLEMKFFLTYILARVITFIFYSTPPVINNITILFGTFGLVIFLAFCFKKKKVLKGDYLENK